MPTFRLSENVHKHLKIHISGVGYLHVELHEGCTGAGSPAEAGDCIFPIRAAPRASGAQVFAHPEAEATVEPLWRKRRRSQAPADGCLL